jgi:hypothetical protein
MGQKISDGKARNLTAPSSKVINSGDLYRITGWNGVAIGAVAAADTARTLAFEADTNAIYSIKVPSGLTPSPGDLLYWATDDDTTYQDGALNLQATPAANDDRPCFFVTGAQNAAHYIQGRVLNGVTGVSVVDISQQARVGQLTDSSGGAAADGTIGAVGTFTPSVAWNGSSVYPSAADATSIATRITALKDAVTELATKINAIETALHASGVTL